MAHFTMDAPSTIAIAKLVSTYTNCGQIAHTFETCHNLERKTLVVLTTTIKSTKLVAQTKRQLVKFVRIPIQCPCIICYSVDLRKTEVQNMFKIKPISSTIVITPKFENVLVNVVVAIIICNQQPK